MTNKKDINAGIIIIGNEILSGRTKDTNTSTLATWLNSLGIKVEEVRVIPDKKVTIIETSNPKVIIHPKSIIGLIPLKIKDRKAQIVVKTV